MAKLAVLGPQVLQFLLALTVLGLAAHFVRIWVIGSAPVTIRYTVFVGAFGMFVAIVGAAVLLFASESASSIVQLGPVLLDAIFAILALAAGIAWAIGLGGGLENCKHGGNMLKNNLLNQGSRGSGKNKVYGVFKGTNDEEKVYHRLQGNCRRARADEALLFISTAISLGFVVYGFLKARKASGGLVSFQLGKLGRRTYVYLEQTVLRVMGL